MVELTLLKKLMLRQVHQKSVLVFFQYKGFKFQVFKCYDVLMMSMNLSSIAILNICGADYRFFISRIKMPQKCIHITADRKSEKT